MEYDSGRHCRLLRGGSSGGSLRSGNRIAEAVRGPRDIWAEGKTKVLGATRLHWADRRVSVAIPDSLSDARMAGVGASCPFPWMLANVPSQSPQQPFAAGNGTGAPRQALIDLLPGKPPEGKLDRGEGDEGFREVLKVLGETPVASEPGGGAFHHPAARQGDEALHVVTPLDDRQAQPRHLCHRSVYLPGVVAAIGPDQLEPRETLAYLVEHQAGPVTILNGGRVDNDPHRQPLAVNQGVDLAALHLLAGVVTHLAVVIAPFSADLITWLSRTAAEGLASRPIRSRDAICSSAQSVSHTRSYWNLRKMS